VFGEPGGALEVIPHLEDSKPSTTHLCRRPAPLGTTGVGEAAFESELRLPHRETKRRQAVALQNEDAIPKDAAMGSHPRRS